MNIQYKVFIITTYEIILVSLFLFCLLYLKL
jgi:hypothetical protein